MFCSKCGKELEESEKFCSSCGERVRKGDVEFSEIVSSVSSKAKEGASYAVEQIKHIDVSDAKRIVMNVTKQNSIAYLIVGVLLLLTSICSVFRVFYVLASILSLMLPAFLNILRLLIYIVIGVGLAVVGTTQLCKDIEQNKPVKVSNSVETSNINMNGAFNPAGTNNFNMNGVPIANYDPKFDYTPIGMWGFFLRYFI